MLALALDITQNKPKHPEEDKSSELKEYMNYQRKLNHERLVYHSLDHAKTYLQKNIDKYEDLPEDLESYLQQAFPLAHGFADADTLILMLRKLLNGHNSSNNWYRLNSYYYAVVYDSMKRFVSVYNKLVRETPAKAKVYRVSEGVEVDFNDWAYLYFQHLDFLIGHPLEIKHYPHAKRNQKIEEDIKAAMKNGKSREVALKAVQDTYEIDDVTLKVLLAQKIGPQDMELFYTSVENPIYEYMTEGEDGAWGDGESLMDHIYYLGSQMKIWEWRKAEEAEAAINEVISKMEKK